MKTNIVSLGEGIWGKKLGEALFATGGNEEEGWDLDVTGIYQTLEGEVVAYDGFMVFPAESTNWKSGGWTQPISRGKANRKANRDYRIDVMCGTYYSKETGLKKYGKNRCLARRMAPNRKYQDEFNDMLPF